MRLTSDPALAKPHASGSALRLVLPCVHDELGPLWVAQVGHLGVHANWAIRMRAQLAELEAKIEALPVQPSGGRDVQDQELVSGLYVAGVDVAVHTIMALQHLVLRLERLAPGGTNRDDLTKRLSAVLKRLGYRKLAEDPRFPALCDIERIRHSIEHPTADNTYTTDPSGWDRVPLTWIASGRSGRYFDQAILLLQDLSAFADVVEKRRKGSRTLQVQRGIKVLNPAKKPRATRVANS